MTFLTDLFQAQSDKVPWTDHDDHGNGEVDSDEEDHHVAEKAKHQVRFCCFKQFQFMANRQ